MGTERVWGPTMRKIYCVIFTFLFLSHVISYWRKKNVAMSISCNLTSENVLSMFFPVCKTIGKCRNHLKIFLNTVIFLT